MQPAERVDDRDSPDSDQAREYRPGVQAIVDAVRSSRRFRGHPQSIPEETATPDDRTESNFTSSETDTPMSSRRMLSERHRRAWRRGKRVTPVERRRRLEDMRDRGDVAAYNSSRLAARLEILDTFIDNALTDDMFMARQEMNPWRFRRNERLQRRWQFVHDAMVTQELLDVIHTAKARKAEEDERRSRADMEKRGSPDGDSLTSQMKETPSFRQSKTDNSSYATSREDLSSRQTHKSDLQTEENSSKCSKEESAASSKLEDAMSKQCTGDTKQTSDAPSAEMPHTELHKTEKPSSSEEKPNKIRTSKPRKVTKTIAKQSLRNLQRSSATLSASRRKNSDTLSAKPSDVPNASRSPYQLPSLTSSSNYRAEKAPNDDVTSAEDSNGSGTSSTSCISAVVILGFGSHHRRDTCDYCGRYRCPGMRNRGRKRKDKQTGSGGFLDERKNDMEGIYDTSHKASERCQKRLVNRMNQLGLK